MSTEQTKPKVSLLVAMDLRNAIGRDGQIPWHLPEDLRLFKENTLGKTVVMGRRTAQSIGRPLPGRRNVVLTSGSRAPFEGQEKASSLKEVIANAAPDEELCIIGGAQLYHEGLLYADRLYISLVFTEVFAADTFMPHFDVEKWKFISTKMHDEVNDGDHKVSPAFLYIVLERRKFTES